MAEKTEEATPKKLKDARKKGQVAKSQDFPSAITFVVSIALVIGLSHYLFQTLASYIIATFSLVKTNADIQQKAPALFIQAIEIIFNTSAPILFLTSCVGVFISFLVVGPLFSLESMKPDIKKLNPISNIKNMFKFKTLFELLKSIFKITGALLLIFSVVWYAIPDIIATASLPVIGSAGAFC